MITFKIYSLNNFWVYNQVLLIIVTILHTRSPELSHPIARSLNPLTNVPSFLPLPKAWLPLILLSLSSAFLGSIQMRTYSICLLLISLRIMALKSIHVAQKERFPLLYGWIIFLCVCASHFLYLSIPSQTLRLFPCLGNCKQCCNKQEGHLTFEIVISLPLGII